MTETSIEAVDRNLMSILGVVTESLINQSPESLRELLHEDVVWDGKHEYQRCSGRDTVLEWLTYGFQRGTRRFDRLDFAASGSDVTVRAHGEGLFDVLPDGEQIPRDSASLTFTFDPDRRIVHIQGG